MVNRKIVAVGHGGLNIERVSNTTIVYDCGSMTPSLIKNQIDSHFFENEIIDILVISHLHEDHVNGVEHLLDRCIVKKVFLPHLTKLQTLLLWDNAKSKNLLVILELLHTFYKHHIIVLKLDISNINRWDIENIKVTYVNADGDDKNKERQEHLEEIDTSISSGVSIYIFDKKYIDWIIMFYYRPEEKKGGSANFKEWLKVQKIDLKEQESWKNKLISMRKKYIELVGNLNNLCMAMYLGPSGNFTKRIPASIRYNHNDLYSPFILNDEYIIYKLGAIYTGDINIKEDKAFDEFKKWYSGVLKQVSMFQVPHHGSKNNFNSKIIDLSSDEGIFNFINARSDNGYGHPHGTVINQFIKNNQILYQVSENNNTTINFNCFLCFYY